MAFQPCAFRNQFLQSDLAQRIGGIERLLTKLLQTLLLRNLGREPDGRFQDSG